MAYICFVCKRDAGPAPEMEAHGQHPKGWYSYIDVLQEPEWTLLCSQDCVATYQASRPPITPEAMQAKALERLRAMSPEDQAAYRAIPGSLKF